MNNDRMELKKLTVRPRLGSGNVKLLERLMESDFSKNFKQFLMENAGLSHYECIYIDESNTKWEVAQYNQFKDLYGLAKEFKEQGWGLKIPFAHDPGGWHFCLSFDSETYGKVFINKWTDHAAEIQFVVIAGSFEGFINGLKEKEDASA